MKRCTRMPRRRTASLWESLARAGLERGRSLCATDTSITLAELESGSALGNRLSELRDRSVLVSTSDQLAAALALIELDGIARRLVLCPSDFDRAHLPYVLATAEIDAIVTDTPAELSGFGVACVMPCHRAVHRQAVDRSARHDTEWILFTSGTTGVPKMVVHTLATLSGAIKPASFGNPPVWATFYDVRRYGGLQILLRALMGGGSLVLSTAGEIAAAF